MPVDSVKAAAASSTQLSHHAPAGLPLSHFAHWEAMREGESHLLAGGLTACAHRSRHSERCFGFVLLYWGAPVLAFTVNGWGGRALVWRPGMRPLSSPLGAPRGVEPKLGEGAAKREGQQPGSPSSRCSAELARPAIGTRCACSPYFDGMHAHTRPHAPTHAHLQADSGYCEELYQQLAAAPCVLVDGRRQASCEHASFHQVQQAGERAWFGGWQELPGALRVLL